MKKQTVMAYLSYKPSIWPKRVKRTIQNISQDYQYPGRPPDYYSGVLTTMP